MQKKINTILKISYLLRFYRSQRNLSQSDMSELVGMSVRNYQRLEGAEVEPKIETLFRVSQVLDLPVHVLFDNEVEHYEDFESVLTKEEIKKFKEINLDPNSVNSLTEFLQRNAYTEVQVEHPTLMGRIEGVEAILSNEFKNYLGIFENKVLVDDYLMNAYVAERWEYIFRNKLNIPIGECAIATPKGIKFFKEVGINLNPSPDNPSVDIVYYDITEQVNLKKWLKSKHSRSIDELKLKKEIVR